MKQKIIRVGNSAAVTLPKKILQEKGLKIGQEAEIEISPADKQTTLSPEFLNWVDTYIEKNRPALEELAKK